MIKEMLEIPRIEELELQGEACLGLRPLWEEVFWEDSREFTDYYFEEKAARNQGFALRIGEEDVSMLYLSPYPVMLRTGNCFSRQEINYIVGVATKEKYRHRGYMDRLLRRALSFMWEKGHPFTFLMPANPKIYRPYQFTYIYDRKIYLWKEHFQEMAGVGLLEEGQVDGLAEYASAYLERNADVFIERSSQYYRVMEKELRAQNGGIYLMQGKNGAIEGYFLYTEEAEGEIQEAIVSGGGKNCPVCASGRRQPVIMARIVDVQALFSLLRTKSRDISWTIQVQDPILPGNNGIWKCRITPDRAFVCRYEEGSTPPECMAGIGQLTAWVFGYQGAEECFSFPEELWKEDLLDRLEEIRKQKRVFLNEIV